MFRTINWKKIGQYAISMTLLFLSILMIRSTDWAIDTFNAIEFSEIVYHLKVPIEGTSSSILESFFLNSFLFSAVVTIVIAWLVSYFCKKYEDKKIFELIRCRKIVSAIIVFVVFGCFSLLRVNALDYVIDITTQSSFIEENYVDGRDVNLNFPENKRNLIYIFLESMESTYLSNDMGGFMEDNLLPNLSQYAKEGVNFSNTNEMGGLYVPQNASWTIAAMVAQTTGLPLSVPIDSNQYYGEKPFLPGAYSIGDILESEGYNQELLIGSKAEFGARNLLFMQHGDYNIDDYHAAIDDGRLPKGYFEWWGYEDSKLFDYAKETLVELSSKPEPFNLTMLTVNTHFQDGYLEESCEVDYDDPYYNVIACSDSQVYEFVEWVKQQEFYENTTIVIVGDHLSMNRKTFDDIEKSDRTVFNVILNSVVETNRTQMRTATTFDMFPTTLASLGIEIEGERLGLGVNLFSEKRTLAEKYGLKMMNEELSYFSKFYNDNLLSIEE
ncbi:LTA synthase family protein [Anaerorhabdus furcosa]|uniref:Phosphoglycerol transferase n=1 Tax=Anaerorhabdus furcosa TaxID=118967 RepID=A0A1T4K105_9FIRM|nr:LTA synthase family protein [Anaerorhabdus furcosa]SJZ36039.1 phosphoglycerol transferase [Anaerorhabdus furcosa]